MTNKMRGDRILLVVGAFMRVYHLRMPMSDFWVLKRVERNIVPKTCNKYFWENHD